MSTSSLRLSLFTLPLAAILLDGCAVSPPDPVRPPITATVRVTVSQPPENPVVQETPEPQPENPVVQETPEPQPDVTYMCLGPDLYQPGSAQYSDGTLGFEAECAPGVSNRYGPDHRPGAVPAG